MERFYNSGDECIVLTRSGDTALIVMPDRTCQPYVVSLMHRKGDSGWWQGKYFDKLEDALEHYLEAVNPS